MFKRIFTLSATALLAAGPALAQDQVLNLYSARHYPSDEALYSQFTRATGIRIQRVDADDAGSPTAHREAETAKAHRG